MRKYLYLLVIMGLSSLALAQNVRQDNIAFSRSGFPAPGALVAVCLQPATAGSTSLTACAPLAPLCSSSTDAICSSPNPVTADGLGNYHFYVKPGTYAIQIYGSGLTLSLLRDQTVGGSSGGSAGAATTEVLANCTATGTILNEGVELSSQVISGVLTACGTVASASSTSVIGICSSGCGITGSAQIAYQAFQSAIFDNQTVIGDVAAPSSSPGQFTDIGAVRVPGVESVGRIASINSGVGTTATINMFTGDMTASGAANGSGNVSQCNTSGGVSFYSAIGTIVVCDPSATLDGNGKLTAKQLVVNGTGPGTVTLQTGTAPANPAAGNGLLYVDSGTGFLSCLNSAGGSCNPLTASLAFSALTSGTNTAAAMAVSTGASLKPSNVGQIAGSQTWLQPGIAATSVSYTSNSGGALSTAGVTIQYTLVSALGETLPSISFQTPGAGVCASSTCQATVVAPTIPSGYTGYSVYSCQTGGCTPLKQAASANCVNITTNCVISTIGAGAGLPTISTAIITPPNVQATNGAAGWIPSVYFPKTDGNYYPWLGVEWNSCDASAGPPLPCGTPMFTHRTWFNDNPANTPVGGKNAFVLIDHLTATGTVTTNQDRALWVDEQNPANDAATRYAMEGIQSELDFNCNGCTINGSPDAEVTSVSAQITTVGASTNWTTTGYNTNAIQGRFFRNGAGVDNAGMNAIYGNFANGNATAPGGTVFSALRGVIDGTVNAVNVKGVGLRIIGPGTTGRFGKTYGILSSAGFTPSAFGGDTDYFISNLTHNWNLLLNANVGLTSIENTDGGTQALPINASVNLTGALGVSQIGSSWTTGYSVTCNTGASTYGYQLVAVDQNGGQVASATGSCVTGANPLTAPNPATLNPGAIVATSAVYRQAVRIDVYRTSGPMALGKIGSLTCNANLPLSSCNAFVDSGLSATGTVPSANTTGGATVAGYLHSSLNTAQLASDFTSAANTSLQAIGVLTWNLDGSAKKYSFHCSLMYSQATANVAMQFGIQAATVNPNDISAKGRVDTSTSAQTSGVLSNLATTTATSIVTFTPSATATVFGADLDGSIDNPANNQGQVVNIMVQTSNSGDLPTVKRGSYCTLY